MKFRRIIIGVLVAALAAVSAMALVSAFTAVTAKAGNQEMRRYVLIVGGDTDSTEQASRWIPVRGANRVYIHTWSTSLAFGANADSTFVDSIATWQTLFSDTITNYISGLPYAADSTMITGVQADSLHGVAVAMAGASKPLRLSGVMTVVYPTIPGNVTLDVEGVIPSNWLRIRVVPRRRSTGATSLATVPNRTNGIRGLKSEAFVYYSNK